MGKPGGTILACASNERSWVIYGGITQLPRSSKVQGRFAKSCPSIRETSIVLQEDWTAAATGFDSPVSDRPVIYETWRYERKRPFEVELVLQNGSSLL